MYFSCFVVLGIINSVRFRCCFHNVVFFLRSDAVVFYSVIAILPVCCRFVDTLLLPRRQLLFVLVLCPESILCVGVPHFITPLFSFVFEFRCRSVLALIAVLHVSVRAPFITLFFSAFGYSAISWFLP